jgi:hypothetical protein
VQQPAQRPPGGPRAPAGSAARSRKAPYGGS